MNESDKQRLIHELANAVEQIKNLEAQLKQLDKRYKSVSENFVDLLDEYTENRTFRGYTDSANIRYEWLERAGLLDGDIGI